MRMLAIAAILASGSAAAGDTIAEDTISRDTGVGDTAARVPRAQEVPMQHDLTPGVELPQVAFTGLDPEEDGALADVSVSPTALTLRGEVVLPLVDGEVAAADVAHGTIPRLRDAAATLPAERLTLQIDRRVPYRTLVRVIQSLRAAGRDQHVLLGRAGAHVLSAPVALAEASPPPRGGAQLVVSLTGDEVKLWSRTGVEGTRERPKLVMHAASGIDLNDLANTLAEIHARRGDGAILVVADGGVATQRTLEVIGAVRATVDGSPLYPDVQLASAD